MHDNLFQLGNFLLHSGKESNFKIECDALTDQDWWALARMIADRCQFRSVIGIPRGGALLANRLRSCIDRTARNDLVVDDVWTTGGSMGVYLNFGGPVIGYVVFARSPILDPRCRALFTLDAQPCHYTDMMVEAGR